MMSKKRFPKLRSLLIFALALACAWAIQQYTFSEEIIRVDGKAVRVIDGDSFAAGEDEFRIYGIDAPEYRQTCLDENGKPWLCGKVARNELEQIMRRDDLSCAVYARDQFGRAVVKCTGQKGTDLGSLLVERGLAASGHHFDETIYATSEREAQKAKRGIWRGEFMRPDVWRGQNSRN